MSATKNKKNYIEFQVGDIVFCPSEFGKNELKVIKVEPVPPGEQPLVLHSQWIIVELNGVEQASKSGYYFVKKQ